MVRELRTMVACGGDDWLVANTKEILGEMKICYVLTGMLVTNLYSFANFCTCAFLCMQIYLT